MDHLSGLLSVALLFAVGTPDVYAAIEPVCKGQSPDDAYLFLRQLDMGYANPKVETSEDLAGTVEALKKTTLCGIQTICLSIMRTTVPDSNDRETLRAKFEMLREIPRYALAVLYNIDYDTGVQLLPALWLLCLYVQDIQFYWHKTRPEQMPGVHEKVTEILTKSTVRDCPAHNEFDVTDPKSRFYDGIPDNISSVYDPARFPSQIVKHFDRIRQVLEKAARENYRRIHANNLLFGADCFQLVKQRLVKIENVYCTSIVWGDTFKELWKAFEVANHTSNLFNGLLGIKKYRFLYLTVLEMVVLRLIWIHLLLVTDENRPEFNDALHETVNSLGDTTGLNDYVAYGKAVEFLKVKSPLPKDTRNAIELISTHLTNSSLLFVGCKVPELVESSNVLLSTDIQANYKLAVDFVNEVKTWLRDYDREFVKSVLALPYQIYENFPVADAK